MLGVKTQDAKNNKNRNQLSPPACNILANIQINFFQSNQIYIHNKQLAFWLVQIIPKENVCLMGGSLNVICQMSPPALSLIVNTKIKL